MKDNIIEENKDIVALKTHNSISETVNSCGHCTQILNEPEAQGFCKCVIEIEQKDGHEICERFLRLYRCAFLYAGGGKRKSEDFRRQAQKSGNR